MSDADREIEILIAVCTALEPLNGGERRRVLKYLWARLVRDFRHKAEGLAEGPPSAESASTPSPSGVKNT